MHRLSRTVPAVALILAFALPALAQQRPDPDSPRYKGVVAIEEFINTEGDEAIASFIEARIAASVREATGDEKLAETLAAIRAEAAGAEVQGGRPIGPLAAEVILDPGDGTQMSIEFELDPADNDRFLMIRSAGHSIG